MEFRLSLETYVLSFILDVMNIKVKFNCRLFEWIQIQISTLKITIENWQGLF